MKKVLFIAALVLLTAFVWALTSRPSEQRAGGGTGVMPFWYSSATISTSSVATTWSTSPVLAADSQRGYVSFCNESTQAGAGIYLGMGATTTGVSGIKIAANSCYDMTQEKMFYGNIYAIASSTANILHIVKGSY